MWMKIIVIYSKTPDYTIWPTYNQWSFYEYFLQVYMSGDGNLLYFFHFMVHEYLAYHRNTFGLWDTCIGFL